MLPTFAYQSSSSRLSSNYSETFPDYMRRLGDWSQMDFEATFDQMLTLLSNDPMTANKHFFQRKQTKNQWARDDPAFAVVVTYLVLVGALAFTIALDRFSMWGYLWTCFYCVAINWLLIGAIIASFTSHIANKFLRVHHSHSMEQEVEWLFAFDVHSNAFFCSFLITYVLQYFLLPILMSKSALSCILSNVLYASASVWYAYNTYLGYKSLPFLGNPQVFLWYPSVIIALLLSVSLVLLAIGIHWNITHIIMLYHYA
jgi:hypothetical protein